MALYSRILRSTLSATLMLMGFALTACDGESTPSAAELPVGVEIGQRAPDVHGTTPAGEPFTLTRGSGATVVVFYRGAACGLCRLQLAQMQEHLAAYRTQGARVLALTLDPPDQSRALKDQMGLEFEIISVDPEVFERWRALEPGSTAPLPATYILDSAGVVRYAHIGRNASDRTTDAGLITLIERIGRS